VFWAIGFVINFIKNYLIMDTFYNRKGGFFKCGGKKYLSEKRGVPKKIQID